MKLLLAVAALGILFAGCQASAASPAAAPANTARASSATASSTAQVPTAQPSAASTSAVASAPDGAMEVKVLDFKILPAQVKSTRAINLFVTNAGPTVHNVTIRDQAGKVLMGTRDLREGESATLIGDLPPGTYITFCTLPGHESLGTKGVLVVRP